MHETISFKPNNLHILFSLNLASTANSAAAFDMLLSGESSARKQTVWRANELAMPENKKQACGFLPLFLRFFPVATHDRCKADDDFDLRLLRPSTLQHWLAREVFHTSDFMHQVLMFILCIYLLKSIIEQRARAPVFRFAAPGKLSFSSDFSPGSVPLANNKY